MSLLYECINGIIQGGLLEGQDDVREGDQIASLCISKLRSMIVVDGDPNLKYVSFLAFNKIARSHSHLVFKHEDVITACIDDPDVSIRLQALDLIAGIANSDNLIAIVERLVSQLEHESGLTTERGELGHGQPNQPVDQDIKTDTRLRLDHPALPVEYKAILIRSILNICAKSTYVNINDFDWYLDVLLRLFKAVPAGLLEIDVNSTPQSRQGPTSPDRDIYHAIGWQLRNVAVRVDAARPQAVSVALSMLDWRSSSKGQNTLGFAAWVIGEYIRYSHDTAGALDSLIRSDTACFSANTTCCHVQAIMKIFAHHLDNLSSSWDAEREKEAQSRRQQIIRFLDPLASHQDLEVQERVVGFLELLRLVDSESASQDGDGAIDQSNAFLAHILPQLFVGSLNPVAPSAQKKVPIPLGLDLQANINENLPNMLELGDSSATLSSLAATFNHLYHLPFTALLNDAKLQNSSTPNFIQNASLERPVEYDEMDRRHYVKQTGNSGLQTEDPFYLAIGGVRSPKVSSSRELLSNNDRDSLDIDSIPIMSLDIEASPETTRQSSMRAEQQRLKPRKFHIVQDTDIEQTLESQEGMGRSQSKTLKGVEFKRLPLRVNAVDKEMFSISNSEEQGGSQVDWRQDDEMVSALAEVERLRLEMQRASDRVEAADGAPAEGTLIKKKKRRKLKQRSEGQSLPEGENLQSTVPTDHSKRKRVKKKQQLQEVVSGSSVLKDS